VLLALDELVDALIELADAGVEVPEEVREKPDEAALVPAPHPLTAKVPVPSNTEATSSP
jgi:hypothetical protein